MSDHDDKASWMRAVGATDASWAPSGELLSLKLGPAPLPPDDDREDPAKSMSPQERQRRERLERRAIAERASGGPVRRLDAELG